MEKKEERDKTIYGKKRNRLGGVKKPEDKKYAHGGGEGGGNKFRGKLQGGGGYTVG
jgi:hypothetical protein